MGLSFGVPGRTVPLTPESRLITRQQLSDPVFYAEVKAGLLDGTVMALDQGIDSVTINDEAVPLTDMRAVEALAASQREWVGAPPANRFLPGLAKHADPAPPNEQGD